MIFLNESFFGGGTRKVAYMASCLEAVLCLDVVNLPKPFVHILLASMSQTIRQIVFTTQAHLHLA